LEEMHLFWRIEDWRFVKDIAWTWRWEIETKLCIVYYNKFSDLVLNQRSNFHPRGFLVSENTGSRPCFSSQTWLIAAQASFASVPRLSGLEMARA